LKTLLWLFLTVSAASAQILSFSHIVLIVQENRTPDNLFYALCLPPYGTARSCSTQPGASKYNIQTAKWLDKTSSTGLTKPQPVALANLWEFRHHHVDFVAMCDANPATGACRNDGAANMACLAGPCPPKGQFRFVDNSSGILNPYLDMVTQYGWANYMFQTNQGPSFPAHQFLFGGTSAPSAADDAAGIFAAENVSVNGIPSGNPPAGCTAAASATVWLIDPSGSENSFVYPCFKHQTIVDVLPSMFTWRYYAPNATGLWTAPNAIRHLCESSGYGGQCMGQAWVNNVDLNPANVLTDIANCNLRSMTWVIPSGPNSDHADGNDGGGPSWVASIVNAIGSSTACDGGNGYWNNTAIVITWDDWGGWYDHEPPTILPAPQGGYQHGFRVPMIVVSAYTPQGLIENNRHDFGSILRFVESNFGVAQGALNFADARATDDLSTFFNLSAAPRPFATINAPLNASFFINDKRTPTDPDDD
jgi:phospholipase C